MLEFEYHLPSEIRVEWDGQKWVPMTPETRQQVALWATLIALTLDSESA